MLPALSLLAGLTAAIAALYYHQRCYRRGGGVGDYDISDIEVLKPVKAPGHAITSEPAIPQALGFAEMDSLVESYFANLDDFGREDFERLYGVAGEPWKSRGASVLVQVINGTIYVDRQRFTSGLPWDRLRLHHILGRLQRILARESLPDLEFILNTHDCPMRDLGGVSGPPVFGITRCRGMRVVPLPQWFAWRDGSFEGWDQRMRHYQAAGGGVSWAERQPRAVFRGNVRPSVLQFNTTTARLQFVNVTGDNLDRLGRTRIYRLGQERPDLLEVGLYGKGLDASRTIIDLLPDYEFRAPLSMAEQAARFRHVVYAEGACGWADRLKILLVADMLILLQTTPCHEFFQPLLQPWVHYVPVANDFANLVAGIEWANAHQDEAREIIDNAADLGLRLNSQAAWDYYLAACLRRYAQLMRYRPVHRPGTDRFLAETRCPNRRDLRCDDSASFTKA